MILRIIASLSLLAMACEAEAQSAPAASDGGTVQFQKLFRSWKKTTPSPARASVRPQKQMMISRHVGTGTGSVIVTSGMGMRVNPIIGRRMFHAGADLAAPLGEAVRATADGNVTHSGWAGGYGLLITLHHADGYETRYGHLSRVEVASGQAVRRGQVIGYVGSTGRSTGPHLHYEIRHDGTAVDPLPYIRP